MRRRIANLWRLLRHRVVWFTALAAALSAMLGFLLCFALEVHPLLELLLVAGMALLVGLLLGVANRSLGYWRTERVLRHYAHVLDQVAEGNMQVRLELPPANVSNETEMLRSLGMTANRMLDQLQAVLRQVSGAMQELEKSTQEILDATALQIRMGNEQDRVVTNTTATVNEVRATVTETAERAQSVAETAQVSVDISQTGTGAVHETIDGMEMIRRRVEDIADNILVLSDQTQQIGEIISTVNNLADQSRMLALNASVEAARAGEEGKGFAVVAMEVRDLAERNRKATVQVREILGEIQQATNKAVMVTEEGTKGVDSGRKLVDKAGEAIAELAKAIEAAAMAAMQIAASTRQQTIGMDQLTDAMRTIKHATTETVNSTIQVETSVNRLRGAALQVNEVLEGLQYE